MLDYHDKIKHILYYHDKKNTKINQTLKKLLFMGSKTDRLPWAIFLERLWAGEILF